MVALGFDGRRIIGITTILALFAGSVVRADDDLPPDESSPVSIGRDLFEREWLPKDPRSPNGDGLGPLFNESSCVACHNQGGVGGAGSAARNVHLVVADTFETPNPTEREAMKASLLQVHPTLRPGKSLIIHRFSTSPTYPEWRNRMDGLNASLTIPFIGEGFGVDFGPIKSKGKGSATANPEGKKLRESLLAQVVGSETKHSNARMSNGVHLTLTQRNTPPLFGAGLLDSIPDHVITMMEKNRDLHWPGVKGVASRDAEGNVGRFGWKAEKAHLRDFVAQACAQELGLHLDEVPQPIDPENPYYVSPGSDMTAQQVDHLTAFVASLPQPRQRPTLEKVEDERVTTGRDHFKEVGCAVCHRPRLGDVSNAYTDLLLHDMGPQLSNNGQYGRAFGDQNAGGSNKTRKAKTKEIVATDAQWRTPPLWGLRDSAPYLHDGRADTIEEAIALHSGEAEPSAKAYFNLSAAQRGEIQTFLKTLVAP